MNRHRKATYTMRREILTQADIKKRVKMFIEEEAKQVADSPLLLSDQFEDFVREAFPFDEPTLDRLFDSDSAKFASTLKKEALELYEAREASFGEEVMRKVERDIYLQVLDNLWMQHLENMTHMREGIHWISVGQKDPLVEYRRQSQRMFEEMQVELRHQVTSAIYSAEPVDESDLDNPIETELTRAARKSVDNASQIIEAEEFHEADFVPEKIQLSKAKKSHEKIKKARKAERKRKRPQRDGSS